MSDEFVDPLLVGLREDMVTRDLQRALDATALETQVAKVDDADFPHVAARFVAGRLEQELQQIRGAEERIEFVNQLLATMNSVNHGEHIEGPEPQQLLSTAKPPHAAPKPPSIPISEVALLTNVQGDPRLGPELKTEMLSADAVDVVMSFVRWSGIRLIAQELQELNRRGVPVRLLTTTYMGATEKRALDYLVNECGAEIRISYDTQTTRLHAKAWVFRRNTGFHTGYIGSSNLSKAAMVDGLEWNVRVSNIQTPALVEKFEATFESYWQSPIFEPYIPEKDGERLQQALNNGAADKVPDSLLATNLDVRPYPHQAIILDDLQHEREVLNRHRNLVVAATGTGKTVIAALDYRRLCENTKGPRPRFLFVAHRREILEQSLRTFRDVLGDGSFGELLRGNYRPTKWDHVFASIQTLSQETVYTKLDRDHFDVVIIDEFHHSAGATYERVIKHFDGCKEFLGLTATPERMDGQNIAAEYFDGRIASELRLWTALDNDLLVPFHYFGIADGVDLSGAQFSAGGYRVADLDRLYTGNDQRAKKIIQATREIVTDTGNMKALGFCVSVDHATYMAEVFNQAGIASGVVTGKTSREDRDQAIKQLAAGELNCLMAVDVFNEGFDLPAIDTVLMMRPTQSATIFIQQLGRGLRRAQNKSVLTVLDFVGHQHKNFRFDIKLHALTGQDRKQLQRSAEHNFPVLPAGCQIVLDEVTQKEVVANLRSQVTMSTKDFLADVRQMSTAAEVKAGLHLKDYLERSDRDLPSVYKPGATRTYLGDKGPNAWVQYEAWANDRSSFRPSEAESKLLQRANKFVHVDDPVRFEGYLRVLNSGKVTPELLQDPLALMLYYSFWPSGHEKGLAAGMAELLNARFVGEELAQIMQFREVVSRVVPRPLSGGLETQPIRSHATYTREELLAGLGVGSLNSEKPGSIREGVKWIPELQTDVLLVTLKKSEADYSPTTMYHDYALTDTLFHWESQSLTREASPTGQRYINHESEGSNVVLFVRKAKNGEIGTEPYTCLGNARYVKHSGENPMQIIWELERPMPASLFEIARAAK